MGLRLYQAPAESDIQPKLFAEKGAAQARSTIRRHRLVRGNDVRDQVRERRRRLLVATASAYMGSEQPTNSGLQVIRDHNGQPVSSLHSADLDRTEHAALLDMATRMGVLDDRVAALFGERWAHMHADLNTTQQEEDDGHDIRLRVRAGASRERQERQERRERREREDLLPPIQSYSDGSTFIPAARLGPLPITPEILAQERLQLQQQQQQSGPRSRARLISYNRAPSETRPEPYALSSMRSTQVPDHPSRSSTTSPAADRPFRRPTATTGRAESRSLVDDMLDWQRPPRRSGQAASTEPSRLDGLGDRNRSLSPEGDHVWDTLLTTLTPDPQPPSLGSSFASASAAAATQSAAAATERTAAAPSGIPWADPEIADDSDLFDPLCEFNSDTDEENNDGYMRNAASRSSRQSQRWADIARESINDGNVDAMGNEEVMQRIVHRLSRREHIPDSWWAEVGITTSIGRDLYRQAHASS